MSTAVVDKVEVHGFGRLGLSVVVVAGKGAAMEGKAAGSMCRNILLQTSWCLGRAVFSWGFPWSSTSRCDGYQASDIEGRKGDEDGDNQRDSLET